MIVGVDTCAQEALDEVEEVAAVADIMKRVEMQEELEAAVGNPVHLRERTIVTQRRRNEMVRAVIERVTQAPPTTSKGLGTLPSALQYPRWFRDTTIWHVTTPALPPSLPLRPTTPSNPTRLRRPHRRARRPS